MERWQQKQTLWLLRAVLDNETSSVKSTILLSLARGRANDIIGYGDTLPDANLRLYYHTWMLCHLLESFPLFAAAPPGQGGSRDRVEFGLGYLFLASGLPTESERRNGTELEQRLRDRGIASGVSPWRCVWTE